MLGTFFTFTEGDVAQVITYIQDVVTDFTPILIPIIAISLGIFIIWAIIKALK